MVEYALRNTVKPIGVAEYTAGKALPADLREQRPSPERLEEELRRRWPKATEESGNTRNRFRPDRHPPRTPAKCS